MSKAKKAVYAEKQKQAAAQTSARDLVPLGESAPLPKAAKVKSRKQSRGK